MMNEKHTIGTLSRLTPIRQSKKTPGHHRKYRGDNVRTENRIWRLYVGGLLIRWSKQDFKNSLFHSRFPTLGQDSLQHAPATNHFELATEGGGEGVANTDQSENLSSDGGSWSIAKKE